MNRLSILLLITLTTLVSISVQGGTLAQFRTILGDIDVELYDQEKPVTTSNFKRLVEAGAYQNTFIHRLVPGFVAQGGGFFSFIPFSTNDFAPPWLNLDSVPHFGSITNEFAVGPFLSNTNGTIAMAKTSDPNSASSQWFFNLVNNAAELDNTNNSGGFTVFGRVIRDANGVLNFLNQRTYGNGLLDMGFWYPNDSLATNLFRTLPVTYPGGFQPWYADLLYVNVTLLRVQIATTGTERHISWNSVAGKTNLVEFTTVMPPAWQALVATNGDGSRFSVADNAETGTFRFYRVRVDY